MWWKLNSQFQTSKDREDISIARSWVEDENFEDSLQGALLPVWVAKAKMEVLQERAKDQLWRSHVKSGKSAMTKYRSKSGMLKKIF